jgi:hypothetical protein
MQPRHPQHPIAHTSFRFNVRNELLFGFGARPMMLTMSDELCTRALGGSVFRFGIAFYGGATRYFATVKP